MIDDLHKFSRDRHGLDLPPGNERRERRDHGPSLRHRRARPWIAVAVLAGLLAAFVLIMLTDDGEPVELPGEQVVQHDLGASVRAATA